MTDAPALRITTWETDTNEPGRTLHDIIEVEAPGRTDGATSHTALSKDAKRRRLMVVLANEIDRLLAGEIGEIGIALHE